MKWLLVFSWIIFSSVLWVPVGKGTFGVCISYQATGQMATYIAYINNQGQIYNRRTLLEDEFVKFASGFWPSVYNPSRENLFVQNGLNCGVIVDSLTKKQYPFCSPMDSLWKIRFHHFPFNTKSEDGWSGRDFRPSIEQEKYLHREFAVLNVDRDFFADTNFWKLLRSVNNPEWINYYRNIP